MKKISPYTAAAVLVVSRFFAYALYIPADNEYPTVTALSCLIMTLIKLVLLLPAILLSKQIFSASSQNLPAPRLKLSKRIYCGAAALVLGISAMIALAAAGSEFRKLIGSVYPDRFSTVGISAIWFAACAYVATMGLRGTSRVSAFLSVIFSVVILLTFIGMRELMITDRVQISKDMLASQLGGSQWRLAAELFDIPIFYGLLPHIDIRTRLSVPKTAVIYLVSDAAMSMMVFFIYASMLGGFKTAAGYSIFTLFSCTQGTFIDRTDGIFTSIVCSCGIAVCAALLLIVYDCVKFFFPECRPVITISIAALIQGLILVSNGSKYNKSINSIFTAAVVVCAVMFALWSVIGAVISKKEVQK